MSLLTSFYTYEVMDGAVVHDVSSEAADHPAEHAIAPLEPNFAWEANEASTQHTLIVDLGETRVCDGFSFIHHETETSGPPTAISLTVEVEYSPNATDWTSIDLAYNSDGSNSPSDLYLESARVKLRHFVDGDGNITRFTGRYWRFTIKGVAPPFEFATSDARLSMLWLFRVNQLDHGAAFPVSDTVVFPTSGLSLPFGKVYRTGYSVNSHTLFVRVWMLTDDRYDVLREVMRECNGTYRPFVLVGDDDVRRLCKFEKDEIDEELLDVGLYRVTCRFVEIPTVGKDGHH